MESVVQRSSAPTRLTLSAIARLLRPDLRRLQVLAFAGPAAFAVAVGLFTNLVLEDALSGLTAHIVASGVAAAGALIFTLWMFGMLASVHRQLQQVARSEERRRISLSLHDDVIQSVYAVQLGLEASLTDVTPAAEAHGLIDKAIKDLDRVVVDVRRHIIEEDLD